MEDKQLDLEEINKLVDGMYEKEEETEATVETVEGTVEGGSHGEKVELVNEAPKEVEEKPKTKKTKGSVEPKPYKPLPEKIEETEDKPKTWLETFIENYDGKSKISKEIEPFLKKNYKGDVYLPWATMERLTYMCDPYAKFTNILNQNGGLVHTDATVNYNKNIQNDKIISETQATMFSHTVKVALEFMGKVFIEDYPIQDSDYSAAKIYNQNLVNRAIQRAKAKVASRATGLGLRLYEGFDLQFEEIKEPVKPALPVEEVKPVEKTVAPKTEVAPKTVAPAKVEEIKPVEVTVEKVVEAPVSVVNEPTMEPDGTANIPQNDIIAEIITLIRNTPVDDINKALQRVNATLVKKYGYGLSTEDTDVQLRTKMSKFPNPEKFKTSIESMINA